MKIAVTIGDCNGIGLEAFVKAIQKFAKYSPEFFGLNRLLLIGNYDIIKSYLNSSGIPADFGDNGFLISNIFIEVINCQKSASVQFGVESSDAGAAAVESIEKAIELTVTGECDAMVTLPISKFSIRKAGCNYPGHTELLGHKCGVENPMMILFAGNLRITPATGHIPVSEVAGRITRNMLKEKINQFNYSLLQDFNLKSPEIAVLGLNPHSGDNGAIGSEETDIIMPAVNEASKSGVNVSGPFPADGFFARRTYKDFDGIISMYHDQGLIPLKMLDGGAGVNFTAGLPIVRTSPDHGTAFDIAGKGIADCISVMKAITSSVEIVENRKKSRNLIPALRE